MVGTPKIQRAENMILSDIGNHFINMGQQICIELCISVDGLGIVNNHPLFMVFISCYLELGSPWRFAGLYNIFFKKSLHFHCKKFLVFE